MAFCSEAGPRGVIRLRVERASLGRGVWAGAGGNGESPDAFWLQVEGSYISAFEFQHLDSAVRARHCWTPPGEQNAERCGEAGLGWRSRGEAPDGRGQTPASWASCLVQTGHGGDACLGLFLGRVTLNM